MGKYNFFLILTCMTCLFYISCEKTGLQINSNNDNRPILTRGDCEECPDENECCCGVWLRGDEEEAMIRLCGTSDGASACSGSNYCGATFSGGGKQDELTDDSHPKHLFCMTEGNAFWIYNRSATETIDLFITCQGDLTLAQILPITIQPLDTLYFEADNICELTPCP